MLLFRGIKRSKMAVVEPSFRVLHNRRSRFRVGKHGWRMCRRRRRKRHHLHMDTYCRKAFFYSLCQSNSSWKLSR